MKHGEHSYEAQSVYSVFGSGVHSLPENRRKKPKTSLRHYTFKGENGNPPSSETQELYDDWMTFEETFETREGEDSFMLTLHSGEGTFYIKEINIEHVQ